MCCNGRRRGRTIGIIDNDRVDLTNLQRQIVHAPNASVRSRSTAPRQLAAMNDGIRIETHPMRSAGQ